MKVIDLLNKIANGEEIPKKIEAFYMIYELDEYNHYKHYSEEMGYEDLFDDIDNDDLDEILNYEVKISEDKKIEKLKWNEKSSYNQEVDTKKVQKILLSRSEQLKSSINEIIDYLEEKE